MLCLIPFVLAAPAPINILFVGNSHTATNQLPEMTQRLLESDGSGRKVEVKQIFVTFLEDAAQSAEYRRELASGKWTVGVFQGAKLSSSHKYEYDHSGVRSILSMARQAHLRSFLFAEWPRRDWNETEWIIGQYKAMLASESATIIPVGRVWDAYRSKSKADLWLGDGNHAQLSGSFLAACTIAAYVRSSGSKLPTYIPSGLDAKQAEAMKRVAFGLAPKPALK